MKKIKFTEVENLIGKNYIIKGIDFVNFSKINSVFEADKESITWISPARKDRQELLSKTNSQLIICDKDLFIESYLDSKCFIIVENPRVVFTRILRIFFSEKIEYPQGIHHTSIISSEAKIHPSVHIGAFCIIGACEIGEGSVILPYTRIHNGVIINQNVKINEYCNIGGDGFGHIWNEENTIEKMPHIGKVIIEDEVEILQFVNIDKGTLDKTHIKKGAILDHYVHIGHNSTVGEYSMVGAKTIFCGGSSIGKNCFIGVQSVIVDAVKIGNNVLVGAGSIVTKTIPDDSKWTGAPARPLDEFVALNKKLKSL
jgi:UDP-3-O-[3-hydroxymyristoyl] glucosamine N-acyltransferase